MQQAKLVSLAQPGVSYVSFDSLQDYQLIYGKMREFTLQRDTNTPDQIWLLEHTPVFTQGQAGNPKHILQTGPIPIVQSDRGGQITYHGPGQIMIYCLLDLTRRKMNIRELLNVLEQTLIALLAMYNIVGHTKPEAPGIYVGTAKIASMGLRVRKGCSYHGVCLNINGDLTPFLSINPCGYKNLPMTQISHFVPNITVNTVHQHLITLLETFLIL